MSSKNLTIFFLICLITQQTYALEFSLNKGSFLKGETIEINGKAESTVSIELIQGTQNEVTHRKVALLDDNSFSFSYKTSFLDPKGAWKITVSDKSESKSKTIVVNPTRESEFLTVTFLSPTPTEYFRTASLNISIKVTDAGKAVANAGVFYWDPRGEKRRLKNNGDGTYSALEKIPFDYGWPSWSLTVIARAASREEGMIGGENSISLAIKPSPIIIELITPKTKEYTVEKNLPLKVRVSYIEGDPVLGADVYATVNYYSLQLVEEAPGIYAATYYQREIKEELLTITFNATDSAKNSGTKTITLKPAGYFYWLISENAIFYIFPVLFVLFIFYFSFKEFKMFATESRLKQKKQKLLALKKKLHESFYQRGIVTKETFNKRNAAYNAELDKINTKLERMRLKERE